MGVKDLWNILSPSCVRKPLFELQGKAIAIDLSGWVVDSQTVTDNVAQPKMYLRNLYFRTAYLLMQGISPVFVLEGKAPNLKHKEIARRNDTRRGNDEKKASKKGGRSRFNTILKECETMLKLMGLECIKGSGEAEAMCAYLNADGLVDGCISQDSDCFLYGAKTVYRNFCISAPGNRSSAGGSVDEYSLEKIERLFKLGRNKMIVLALLCGCDYDEGINGVGKEAALKLFKIVDDKDILERIKSWSTDAKFEQMESTLKDPNICTSCGHHGKVKLHTKSGCSDCGTISKCDESYKETRALISNEIILRKKALSTEGFPNLELIDEFLVRRDRMPSRLDLQWRRPNIVEFVNFMQRHVCWEPEYAFAKIFPLTTRWQLRHFAHIPTEDRMLMNSTMIPERIKKIRNVKCVASYEVIWIDKDGILEGLTLGKTSDEESSIDRENENNELVSIEPQDAFKKCYPEITEEFENARLAKKKKPAAKGRKKKVPLMENNEKQTETMAKEKKAIRRPRKLAAAKGNRKIDEFIEKIQTLEESFEAMTIAKKRCKPDDLENFGKPVASATPKKGPQFDRLLASEAVTTKNNDTLGKMFDELTPDDFPSEMENESLEISEIIDRVCGTQTTGIQCESRTIGVRTIDDNSEKNVSINSESDEISEIIDRACDKRTSVIQCESRTIGVRTIVDDSEKNVSMNSENSSHDKKFRTVINQDSFDEFDDVYVPLSQRLRLPNQSDEHKGRISKKCSLQIDDLMNDSDI